jgi:hypothetical protein
MEDTEDFPELQPRGDETKQPDIDVKTLTSLELMKFLGDHWDTRALSTVFFSFSSTDSFVYYRAVPAHCDFFRTCSGGARYVAIAQNSFKILRIEITSS